jgi:hypothetical protein
MTPGLPHQIRGMVLWNSSPTLSGLRLRGFHPLWQVVSGHFDLTSEEEAGSATLHLHIVSHVDSVWTVPFSLAVNQGITIVFFSSA